MILMFILGLTCKRPNVEPKARTVQLVELDLKIPEMPSEE